MMKERQENKKKQQFHKQGNLQILASKNLWVVVWFSDVLQVTCFDQGFSWICNVYNIFLSRINYDAQSTFQKFSA